MPGRTAQNGYGKFHRRLRADYVRRMKAGEQFTCWRCGRWIDPTSEWDLGHDDHDRSVYRGPEHVYCNRSAAKRSPAQLKSVRWRGKVRRRCVICGREFRPGSYSQRACGRTCGIELNRRNRPPRPTTVRSCAECGQEFVAYTSSTKLTCSRKCAGKRKGRRLTQVVICDVCGQESSTKTCTPECHRTRSRNRYREKAGIPLNAPVRPKRKNGWQKLLEKNRAG